MHLYAPHWDKRYLPGDKLCHISQVRYGSLLP
jgi:hypothetical protein